MFSNYNNFTDALKFNVANDKIEKYAKFLKSRANDNMELTYLVEYDAIDIITNLGPEEYTLNIISKAIIKKYCKKRYKKHAQCDIFDSTRDKIMNNFMTKNKLAKQKIQNI